MPLRSVMQETADFATGRNDRSITSTLGVQGFGGSRVLGILWCSSSSSSSSKRGGGGGVVGAVVVAARAIAIV